jgi:trehalose-phosphatase
MEAKPYAGVPERLTRLAGIPQIRLAILSGRPVKDFSSLLPHELNLEIWGSHGRERLCADGSYQTVPLNPIQKGYFAEFEKVITSEGFAFALEHKVGSLALHTRGLDIENANRIIKAVRKHYETFALRENSLSLEWLSFDGGIEIRGRGWTKGDAVASILAEFPSDVPVACLGDDQTDEDAFRMLEKRVNAASVLVRSRLKETAAKWWLTPPQELLAFLDRYLEAQGQVYE